MKINEIYGNRISYQIGNNERFSDKETLNKLIIKLEKKLSSNFYSSITDILSSFEGLSLRLIPQFGHGVNQILEVGKYQF